MPTGSTPNPYDPDELKRQAQIDALGPSKTSEEYYALNQANAAKNPVAGVTRPTMDEFKAKNTSIYGHDGTYAGNNKYQAEKHKRDILLKAVLPTVAFGVGGAATAAMTGGFGLGGGAASGFSAAPGVTMAVDGSALGTGAAAGGGKAAAASKGIPWGKLAGAATNLIPSGGGEPQQDASAFQQPGGNLPPPMTTPNPVGDITGGTNTGVVDPRKQTGSTANVAPVNSPPPPGWDAKNWADPNMHTVKYDAGRLLVGATKPSEIAARVNSPEFQARFPGATFDGKDKIDFKGALSEGTTGEPVGMIDVLMAADQGADTSNGLWWGFEPDGEGGDVEPMTKQATKSGINPADDNSTLAKIMAELDAASRGTQSPAARAAIMGLL